MRRATLAFALVVGIPSATSEAPGSPIPIAGEFQVSTDTSTPARFPQIAMARRGAFMVVWEAGGDGSTTGIFGRYFDSNGVPSGPEFQVNSFTTGYQFGARIAALSSGGFVVVWGSGGVDGNGFGVAGRRFDSSGEAEGDEFVVNAFTTGAQYTPSVATDGVDGFVVAWRSRPDIINDEIAARRFDSSGTPIGDDISVGFGLAPSVAVRSAGDFVIAWEEYHPRLAGRWLDPDGVMPEPEFTVGDSSSVSHLFESSIVADASRGFAVAWVTNRLQPIWEVFVHRFGIDGTTRGLDVQVDSPTFGNQRGPSIASNDVGDFVVSWTNTGRDGDGSGVFGRRVERTGVAPDPDFRVNTYTVGVQGYSSVGIDAAGHFVVVWRDEDHGLASGGIFGQAFAPPFVIQGPAPGASVDCHDPRGVRPTIAWSPDRFDRFRVELSTDPSFVSGTVVTSGAVVLKGSSYALPTKKWKAACKKAIAADPVSPHLFARVRGADLAYPKFDVSRERVSPFIRVEVTP